MNARQADYMRANGLTHREYYSPSRSDVGVTAARWGSATCVIQPLRFEQAPTSALRGALPACAARAPGVPSRIPLLSSHAASEQPQ